MISMTAYWPYQRHELIRRHDFQVNERRQVFYEVSKALERAEANADDRFDMLVGAGVLPYDAYPEAVEAGFEMYEDLEDKERIDRLGALSHIINEFEQSLRMVMESELSKKYDKAGVVKFCRKKPLNELYNVLESSGWELRRQPWFCLIECGCAIINSTKHGAGRSLDVIAEKFPYHLREYYKECQGLSDPVRKALYSSPDPKDLDINAAEFEEITDAIKSFWQEFPNELRV